MCVECAVSVFLAAVWLLGAFGVHHVAHAQRVPVPAMTGSATATDSATESSTVTEGGTANEPTSGTATEGATATAGEGETEGEWPTVVCGGNACGADQFCLRPIPSCQLVPDSCVGDETDTGETGDEDAQCWEMVQTPDSCLPIPAGCQGTPAEINACIQERAFDHCPYGGEVTDGLLWCFFNTVDGCEEGLSPHPTCQPCL
jgi:hypothetical protein